MSLTAVAFVLAFAVGCVLAFARHPIYGLVTFVGVLYLHPPSRWWGQGVLLEVRWSLIAAAVTLLAIAFSRRHSKPVTGFFRQKFILVFMGFILWMAVQSFWALNADAHGLVLSYYVKFLMAMYMIYKCVDSEEHLRLFLWAHVLGCFYFGWIAFTSYSGGRFEGFGGPGLGEANAGGLQIVTGVLVAASLFLAGRLWSKITLVGLLPLMVNALVTTISRSSFLAFAVGGLVFVFFTPRRYSPRVRVLSVLGLVLFVLLTNPVYWARMATLKYRGAEVEAVDTGGGRLDIIAGQWRMFQAHPLGCGHMCTTTLSPSYLDEKNLAGGAGGFRASHNTFMSMLVDHGIPGGVVYLGALLWIYLSLRKLARHYVSKDGLLAAVLPSVAGGLGAIFVADLFVQYVRLEVRFWLIAVLMVLLRWAADSGRENQAVQVESATSSSRLASRSASRSRE